MGNRVAFPEGSHLRQSLATQSTVHAGCFTVSIIHRTLTWIFNVHRNLMHAIAHRGVRTHVRESALKVDWEKNLLPHRGIETASTAWRSDALPVNYIPTPAGVFYEETPYLSAYSLYILQSLSTTSWWGSQTGSAYTIRPTTKRKHYIKEFAL